MNGSRLDSSNITSSRLAITPKLNDWRETLPGTLLLLILRNECTKTMTSKLDDAGISDALDLQRHLNAIRTVSFRNRRRECGQRVSRFALRSSEKWNSIVMRVASTETIQC